MRHAQYGRSSGRQTAEKSRQLSPTLSSSSASRLIGQQKAFVQHGGHGQNDTLPLSARQLDHLTMEQSPAPVPITSKNVTAFLPKNPCPGSLSGEKEGATFLLPTQPEGTVPEAHRPCVSGYAPPYALSTPPRRQTPALTPTAGTPTPHAAAKSCRNRTHRSRKPTCLPVPPD